MSAGSDDLYARRRELIARSDAHRDEIARAIGVWRRPLEGVDRAVAVMGEVRRHAPWLVGGVAAVWMAARGRRPGGLRTSEAGGMLAKARTAWRVAQTVASVVSGFRRGGGRQG